MQTLTINLVFPVPGELCWIVCLPLSAFVLITVFVMTSSIPNGRRFYNLKASCGPNLLFRGPEREGTNTMPVISL